MRMSGRLQQIIVPSTAIFAFLLFVAGCQPRGVTSSAVPNQADVSIPYERYQLENGLTVILHQDTSDPLVHVDMTYHVGSAREELGKSGFAHFFEHMMFQGSRHVADEQHFQIITEAGGSLNGSTNTDRTNYYQTVPANQLEKVLWLESDRMGFLLETVSQEKFEIQRETVKNERAQRVDNQPYGLRSERTSEALYPVGHPYSWSTIGYVEDLDRVNVNDLKAFFLRWYGPNNATLTIGGDIDIAQTKAWIEKYFGVIPRGPEVEQPTPQPVQLTQNRYITLEDNVHLPLLQITLPTVYARHPDEAPLDVLADILGGGKTSLLYKNLVKQGIAVQAVASHPCRELACEFQLLALANPSAVSELSQLEGLLQQTLEEFEQRGVTADDLARTKASIEAATVFGLQSVAGKVSTLAANQTFSGEPDLVATDIARYNAVTAEDVMRVYQQYVKGGKGVILSVVPHGQAQLAAKAQNFTLPTRDFSQISAAQEPRYELLKSDFDRSMVPPAGAPVTVPVPEFWRTTLGDSIPVMGITSTETPTVTLTIKLEGGMLLDSLDKAGLASLTALMLNESTQGYSNEEMANELAKLGSSISFSASGRYTQIYVSTLTKHLDKTLELLQEKLFRPAFLASDFERMKQRLLQSKQQQLKNPSVLASLARDKLLFGEQNRISLPDDGTLTSLSALTLDEVKAFYAKYYSPAKASVVIVANRTKAQIEQDLAWLGAWQGEDYDIAEYAAFPEYTEQAIYLIDQPDAVQSVVSIVKRSLPYDADGEYFLNRLMNFPLGGAFNSRVNLKLREDMGITYGATTGFVGGKTLGWFSASADITAANTADGISALLTEIRQYQQAGMTNEELAFMRNAFTLSDALNYETPSSKAQFLGHMQAYDLDAGYRQRQIDTIRGISLDTLNQQAAKWLTDDTMQIIVVGDKASLLPQLEALDIPIRSLSLPQ